MKCWVTLSEFGHRPSKAYIRPDVMQFHPGGIYNAEVACHGPYLEASQQSSGLSPFFCASVDSRVTRDQRGQLGVRRIFRFDVVRFVTLAVGVLGDDCVHSRRGHI
ncbi:hypothetical protein CSKR_106661 [Clonorchis sinensis]|uniref:Uncharacterized protein n=1 Tax=Clonorchis sinensis TaxID=79923 RepID=A0A419Q0Y1_CLOSI|nr:hypothetical protein CSKR_106661 [Clonorchis sinensis]